MAESAIFEPMLFKDVIGQTEVKKRLIQSVKEERISHAQLFSGHEGTGKLAWQLLMHNIFRVKTAPKPIHVEFVRRAINTINWHILICTLCSQFLTRQKPKIR